MGETSDSVYNPYMGRNLRYRTEDDGAVYEEVQVGPDLWETVAQVRPPNDDEIARQPQTDREDDGA